MFSRVRVRCERANALATHVQIRVHLRHIGHAIVGDDMYGGRPLVMGDVMRQQDLAALPKKSPKLLLLSRQVALAFSCTLACTLLCAHTYAHSKTRTMRKAVRFNPGAHGSIS